MNIMQMRQKILRVLFPADEQHRMELRETIARSTANAEDLSRTLRMRQYDLVDAISRRINDVTIDNAPVRRALQNAERKLL